VSVDGSFELSPLVTDALNTARLEEVTAVLHGSCIALEYRTVLVLVLLQHNNDDNNNRHRTLNFLGDGHGHVTKS
jgi:hypothetical protein